MFFIVVLGSNIFGGHHENLLELGGNIFKTPKSGGKKKKKGLKMNVEIFIF
jgi:hypothetical protein